MEKKELAIQMDPAIAAIFQRSNAVSTSKGTSNDMLKIGSKRRRTTQEKADDDAKEAQQKAEVQAKYDMIKQMEQELAATKSKLHASEKAIDVL